MGTRAAAQQVRQNRVVRSLQPVRRYLLDAVLSVPEPDPAAAAATGAPAEAPTPTPASAVAPVSPGYASYASYAGYKREFSVCVASCRNSNEEP